MADSSRGPQQTDVLTPPPLGVVTWLDGEVNDEVDMDTCVEDMDTCVEVMDTCVEDMTLLLSVLTAVEKPLVSEDVVVAADVERVAVEAEEVVRVLGGDVAELPPLWLGDVAVVVVTMPSVEKLRTPVMVAVIFVIVALVQELHTVTFSP